MPMMDLTYPAGALSSDASAAAMATRVLAAAAGLAEAEAMRIWVVIHEVPDGNWGAGGQIVRFAQLREMASAAREQVA